MSQSQAGYGSATVEDRWDCPSCKARLWAEASYCPLCGKAKDNAVGDRPDPRELRITLLEARVKELQREVQQERDLRETKAEELTQTLRTLEGQRVENKDLRVQIEDLRRDVARLEQQVARLKSFGPHWLWPLALGTLAGALVGAVATGLFRPDSAPLASIPLDEQWALLTLPEDEAVTLSSDRPFRVRGPEGLFVVEPGESVALPEGGPIEARAVEGQAMLSVAPAR